MGITRPLRIFRILYVGSSLRTASNAIERSAPLSDSHKKCKHTHIGKRFFNHQPTAQLDDSGFCTKVYALPLFYEPICRETSRPLHHFESVSNRLLRLQICLKSFLRYSKVLSQPCNNSGHDMSLISWIRFLAFNVVTGCICSLISNRRTLVLTTSSGRRGPA